MSDIEEALGEHFGEDQIGPIAKLLEAGRSYGKGDALAGAKLAELKSDDYDRLTEVFQEAGFDVTFNNRMSLVGFTSTPETHDDELNEAIRDL